MNLGVAHRVPLSGPVLALLAELPRDGDLVFGKLVNNSLIRLLDRFKLINRARQKITAHGFRGAFSTWTAAAKFPMRFANWSGSLAGTKTRGIT